MYLTFLLLFLSATFQFLLRRTMPAPSEATCTKYLISLLIIALTCTPIMTLQVNIWANCDRSITPEWGARKLIMGEKLKVI